MIKDLGKTKGVELGSRLQHSMEGMKSFPQCGKIDGTYMVPSPSFRMEGQTARCLYLLQLQRKP